MEPIGASGFDDAQPRYDPSRLVTIRSYPSWVADDQAFYWYNAHGYLSRGTLDDWEREMTEAFRELVSRIRSEAASGKRKGWPVPPGDL